MHSKTKRTKRRKNQHRKRRYTNKWRGGQSKQPLKDLKPRDVNIYATRVYHNPRENAPMAFFSNFYPDKDTLKSMLGKYDISDDEMKDIRVNKITNFNQIDHMFVLRNANDMFTSILRPMMFVAPKKEIPIKEEHINKKK